jgi:hypothetical protein
LLQNFTLQAVRAEMEGAYPWVVGGSAGAGASSGAGVVAGADGGVDASDGGGDDVKLPAVVVDFSGMQGPTTESNWLVPGSVITGVGEAFLIQFGYHYRLYWPRWWPSIKMLCCDGSISLVDKGVMIHNVEVCCGLNRQAYPNDSTQALQIVRDAAVDIFVCFTEWPPDYLPEGTRTEGGKPVHIISTNCRHFSTRMPPRCTLPFLASILACIACLLCSGLDRQ